MKKSKKFSDIIERIEYLRNLLKMNKSRFSADIGMKPQTYNNFIGAQGSKPNVELIYGIVNKFGVNPMWLLNGTGAIFQDDQARSDYQSITETGIRGLAGVQEGAGGISQEAAIQNISALKKEIKEIEPLLEKIESKIKQMEQIHQPVVDRYIGLIKRYYELDPLSAIEEFKELLRRMEVRIGDKPEREKANKQKANQK